MSELVPSMNNKHFLDLPETVLEEILSFLDFDTKKSFSLCCKKLNDIFGLPRNLKKVILRVTGKNIDRFDKITRLYKNVEEEGTFIPANIWSKLTKITSYTNARYSSCTTAVHLMNMLPLFSNLVCLNVCFSLTKLEEEKLKELVEQSNVETVEMKSLKVLKINMEFFLILNQSILKFSTADLSTLVFENHSYHSEVDYDLLRFFISSQKNLRKLSLFGTNRNICQFFDTPLIAGDSLKSLEVRGFDNVNHNVTFNSTRQDNLSDLIVSQKALEKLDIVIKVDSPETAKLKYLKRLRLTMGLTYQSFNIFTDVNSYEEYQQKVDFKKFILEEIVSMPKKTIPTVKNIELKYWCGSKSIYGFISASYPNLTSLTINEYVETIDGIAALNDLEHLNSLTLMVRRFEDLPTINIPSLEKIKLLLEHDDDRTDKWTQKDFNGLRNFLQSHKLLEDFYLKIDGYVDFKELRSMISDFQDFLEFVLIQLSDLRKLHFNVGLLYVASLYDSDDDNEWEGLTWENVSKPYAELIEKYAQCGLIFTCGDDANKKLMKKFDGTVVLLERDLSYEKIEYYWSDSD